MTNNLLNPKVTVLMSTYNGEKYLREQLDSLLRQEGVQLKIVIRDDGSKDGTIGILQEYCDKYGCISYYTGRNLGPAGSFFDLIRRERGADYYALCDQDDVWDPDKLRAAVRKLSVYDSAVPLLYYSNLKIVDQDLNFCRLSHSKMRGHKNKYCALTEGFMTGCTGVFNEALAGILRDHIPEKCSMHDTWIYMTAAFFGKTVYDFYPHIMYRQHAGNVIGVHTSRFNWKGVTNRLKRLFNRDLQPKYRNAVAFLDVYSDMLNEKDRAVVSEMAHYKDSLKDWMKLLFGTRIHTTSPEREMRYRGLIMLRII